MDRTMGMVTYRLSLYLEPPAMRMTSGEISARAMAPMDTNTTYAEAARRMAGYSLAFIFSKNQGAQAVSMEL